MNRIGYAPYKGEIHLFFPPGLIGLVGLSGNRTNPYLKRSGIGGMDAEVRLAAPKEGDGASALERRSTCRTALI